MDVPTKITITTYDAKIMARRIHHAKLLIMLSMEIPATPITEAAMPISANPYAALSFHNLETFDKGDFISNLFSSTYWFILPNYIPYVANFQVIDKMSQENSSTFLDVCDIYVRINHADFKKGLQKTYNLLYNSYNT